MRKFKSQLQRRWALSVVFLCLLAVAFAGPAFAFRTKPGYDVLRLLSDRPIRQPCAGWASAPSGDADLGGCIVERRAVLERLTVSVGSNGGTSGGTSVYLQLNGVTILSSTVTVGYDAGSPATRYTTFDQVQLDAGDLLTIRVGAVTPSVNSAHVAARADLAERF